MLSLFLTLSLAQAADKVSPSMTLEHAKKMMSAAESYAKGKKVPCAIAVADDTGYPVMMEKMDNVMMASTSLAPEKAKTAVMFKKNTADIEKMINEGRTAMVTAGPWTLMQGGLVILHEGKVVGAIAASCDVKDQDIPVAQAGFEAFKP